ncbi:unnamed protein product [Rangifer tarandus platyrhynchus]|uniref:Uncharacterized protein n=1 Tax=Rangifer tarandus platyrhynchus TaxID=3082113 RepID=A0ABN8XJD2_RANTA|nr:unnamed protein product [Rangifer tarandus platyrhynchus]
MGWIRLVRRMLKGHAAADSSYLYRMRDREDVKLQSALECTRSGPSSFPTAFIADAKSGKTLFDLRTVLASNSCDQPPYRHVHAPSCGTRLCPPAGELRWTWVESERRPRARRSNLANSGCAGTNKGAPRMAADMVPFRDAPYDEKHHNENAVRPGMRLVTVNRLGYTVTRKGILSVYLASHTKQRSPPSRSARFTIGHQIRERTTLEHRCSRPVLAGRTLVSVITALERLLCFALRTGHCSRLERLAPSQAPPLPGTAGARTLRNRRSV